MSSKAFIRPGACCLLLAFSIPIIVGFACAIGIDMGYNASHRAEMQASGTNAHSAEYGHNNNTGHPDDPGKNHPQSAQHNETRDAHGGANPGDCCNNEIASLAREDKNLARSLLIEHPGPEYIYPAPCYIAKTSFYNSLNTDKKHFVRNHHPPIPDIRIAIQSLQI